MFGPRRDAQSIGKNTTPTDRNATNENVARSVTTRYHSPQRCIDGSSRSPAWVWINKHQISGPEGELACSHSLSVLNATWPKDPWNKHFRTGVDHRPSEMTPGLTRVFPLSTIRSAVEPLYPIYILQRSLLLFRP